MLALTSFGMGCGAGGTHAEDEQQPTTVEPTIARGERCRTSGAPPCAPGLVCLPDPAFASVPEEPGQDPGARPWICQPEGACGTLPQSSSPGRGAVKPLPKLDTLTPIPCMSAMSTLPLP